MKTMKDETKKEDLYMRHLNLQIEKEKLKC